MKPVKGKTQNLKFQKFFLQKKDYLKIVIRAYYWIITKITRSAILVEIDTKDVNLVKTNNSSFHLSERKDEILFFSNFTSLVLISKDFYEDSPRMK